MESMNPCESIIVLERSMSAEGGFAFEIGSKSVLEISGRLIRSILSWELEW